MNSKKIFETAKKKTLDSVQSKINIPGLSRKDAPTLGVEKLKDVAKKSVLKWALGILIPILPYAVAVFFVVLLLLVVVGSLTTEFSGGSWGIPKNIKPSSGIPKEFVADVQLASEAQRVPMQFISGEVMTESAWDPNAYADYGGSHAMGLMQFEPGTWSGSQDPYSTISEPDTDEARIVKYGGFGIDAQGIVAPVGTSAQENASELAQLSRQCQSMPSNACAHYASPFDPADALVGGAYYLDYLYALYGSWPLASEHYYGGSDPGAYAETVLKFAYAYIADTPPVQVNGAYFLFGKGLFNESPQGNGAFVSMKSDSTNLESEYAPSFPVIAPVSGLAVWHTAKGSPFSSLTVQTKNGKITISGQIIPWLYQQYNGTFQVKAGDVIAFANLKTGVSISEPLTKVFPGSASASLLD